MESETETQHTASKRQCSAAGCPALKRIGRSASKSRSRERDEDEEYSDEKNPRQGNEEEDGKLEADLMG